MCKLFLHCNYLGKLYRCRFCEHIQYTCVSVCVHTYNARAAEELTTQPACTTKDTLTLVLFYLRIAAEKETLLRY